MENNTVLNQKLLNELFFAILSCKSGWVMEVINKIEKKYKIKFDYEVNPAMKIATIEQLYEELKNKKLI